MALDPAFMAYPHRSYGMDHDRYAWSPIRSRTPVTWPDGADLALWITIAVEWFPQDMGKKPFAVPGGMVTPYPDLRHYSLRDYGNRIGIFRLLEALRARGLKASVPMNSAVAQRYPYLVEAVVEAGHEVIAHGVDMGRPIHAELSEAEEVAIIEESLEVLRSATGQPVTGWLGVAKSESFRTPDLLAARGISYLCDWPNDDLPYPFRTQAGTLHAMPHSGELDDYLILMHYRHDEERFVEQVVDARTALAGDARRFGGRVMSLALTSWVTGQPHRIGAVEAALDHVLEAGAIWNATGAEILATWLAQKSAG